MFIRRIPTTALAAAVIVSGLAAVQATASEPPPGQDLLTSSIPWKDCGEQLQCARIRVPLDWDRPQGRTIGLAVIRHLASNPERRIGSMFINPGGPGQSGVELVKGAGSDLDTWGDGRFDVVSWDPRGTNASTPVRCFRSEASEAKFWKGATIPTTKAQSKSFSRKSAALARRCGKISGWLLPHISTADTARDLDHLRALVGDRGLTYVGLSYGTLLGQTYANMYPRRVRAMLLDGVVEAVQYSRSAEARAANSVSGSDAVFNQFLRLCQRAGPQECALAGGKRTPSEKFERLLKRVRNSPIPAPDVDPPGALNLGDLLLSQFQPLRVPAEWPANAASLDAALTGNASTLEAGAQPFLTPQGWAGATTSAAISCADAPARRELDAWPQVIGRLDRISRMQGRVNGWWLWAPCAAWPVRGQDSYRGPWNASTPNPILLIGTRFDPNTAYQNAVSAERYLGNAVLLTHNGYGHISYQDPSACVDRARVDYLVDLKTPRRGAVCQSDLRPFQPSPGPVG
ncbi:MAG: alpha/beta hydrolase [Candidatus Nanopelagicales bacterium]|nr:alpha/beta hydrolase [Candidatus Nanopelagicales bacterium]